VAERAAVTDTHALLFYAAGGQKLGSKAAGYFASASQGVALIYVPMAVLMEIVFITRAGRGGLRVRPREFFEILFLNPAFQPLELTTAQILDGGDLRFNQDPYDALIVAAAHAVDLPLITRDAAIVESGEVKVIW
jgi:PIN domain nuclease of toxin-antitoxin system